MARPKIRDGRKNINLANHQNPSTLKSPDHQNSSAYQAKAKWYHFKSKNAVRAQAARRYENALELHEMKMAEFYDKYPEFFGAMRWV